MPKKEDTNSKWRYVNYIPNHVREPRKYHKNVYRVFTDEICYSYAVDYIDWATIVAKTHNIKIHWSSWDIDTHKFLDDIVDSSFLWPLGGPIARDRMHPGPKAHNKLAQLCYELLQEKL